MAIRIQIKVSGEQEAIRLLDKITDKLQHDTDDGLRRAVQEVAKVFEQNYRSEGALVGGWPQLAEATIERREEQGFPGAHPILVRYGALRGIAVDDIKAGRPGRFRRTDNYSGHVTTGSLEIDDKVATLVAEGWKVGNQYGHPNRSGRPIPARPFWFANRYSALAARDGVTLWLVDEVLKK